MRESIAATRSSTSSCSGGEAFEGMLRDEYARKLSGWVGAPDDEFEAVMLAGTPGERWVVAGNYLRVSQRALWPRADTVVWLDLPLPLGSISNRRSLIGIDNLSMGSMDNMLAHLDNPAFRFLQRDVTDPSASTA